MPISRGSDTRAKEFAHRPLVFLAILTMKILILYERVKTSEHLAHEIELRMSPAEGVLPDTLALFRRTAHTGDVQKNSLRLQVASTGRLLATAPHSHPDLRTNSAVFLSKGKIMNTVCGLKNNTVRLENTNRKFHLK